MYLSRLDIVGFKSFAQKTTFLFSGGMTGFVGPNGCGKTNVVDAIRWVLGEQKTTVLRSDIMENVIFNGTSTRKPLGMAEVSMTLNNNKGILPTEYNDVTITRRLFRNGDSQYLINNTVCLLRNIVDLFMDTGMGSDSYSVIELKMVEAILSGRPEERRTLLEEAAGVKKYKNRRKEAGKKLSSVQSDLLRVDDILQEVQKNVNSLSRQAAKTRRYNKLLEELKLLEVNLLKHEYADVKTSIDKIEIELAELQTTKLAHEKELSEIEESVGVLKNNLGLLNTQYQDARNNENFLNSAISQKNQDRAVSQEKKIAIETAQERIHIEINEANIQIGSLDSALAATAEKISLANESLQSSESELANYKTLRDSVQSDVTSARDDSAMLNENVIVLQNQLNSLSSEIGRISTSKEDLEQKIDRTQVEIEKLDDSISVVKEEQDSVSSKRNELIARTKTCEDDLSKSQEKQGQLQTTIEDLRNKIADSKNKLTGNSATLDFLSGLIDSDESSKYLINSGEWKTESEKIQLAEAVGIDEKYAYAVSSALGETAKFFVVDSKEEAYSAINALKSAEKGKAAFICKEIIPEIKAPAKIDSGNGVIGWLSELVRTDDKLRSALRAILGKTLLVETSEKAWEVIDSKIADCAVTPDGELIRSEGVVRGGSLNKTEALTIGKRERIENLTKEINTLNVQIKELEEAHQSAKTELSAIDIRALGEALRAAQNELNRNEQKITELGYKAENIQKSKEMLENNLSVNSEDILKMENLLNSNSDQMKDLDEKLMLAKEEYKSSLAELNSIQEKFSLSNEDYRQSEMAKVKLEEEHKSLQREIQRLEQDKVNLFKRIDNRNDELENNAKEIAILIEKIEKLENEIEETTTLAATAQSKREYFEAEIKTLQEQIEQYSEDITQKRRNAEKSLEAVHRQEIRLSELRTHLKNILNRAQEGYELDLETIDIEIDDTFSIEETKAEVHDLKDKLNQLGSVNFMALEEFEQQNERALFYESQIKDLRESEKNLQETINEINQTAEQKFRETFDKVNANFKVLFSKLFGAEGESELMLADGDPLESNIEIMAKPPGKKPNSIEALSAGEKTLTAIALLFGIYLVKPSPFCILDEVDAPLDDMNIGRFIDMIKEFSANTQFLIVTHNKKTMEAADTLYGVTMQEEGISKIVSARLMQDEDNKQE